ncbi:hypothetical protein MPUL_31690 [Mycolicibacterium pulveris]|uniref:Uncharacterized protein n=1 Tax=Mycolicibacterium pulveris TaxID=36813 RepID=A0A7I7UMC4_MYCPV|nr:hypothetical protein MPUL_31690 [Mycolicibacterium pulveris]
MCELKDGHIEVWPRWLDPIENPDPDVPTVLTFDETEDLYQTLFRLRRIGKGEVTE